MIIAGCLLNITILLASILIFKQIIGSFVKLGWRLAKNFLRTIRHKFNGKQHYHRWQMDLELVNADVPLLFGMVIA